MEAISQTIGKTRRCMCVFGLWDAFRNRARKHAAADATGVFLFGGLPDQPVLAVLSRPLLPISLCLLVGMPSDGTWACVVCALFAERVRAGVQIGAGPFPALRANWLHAAKFGSTLSDSERRAHRAEDTCCARVDERVSGIFLFLHARLSSSPVRAHLSERKQR